MRGFPTPPPRGGVPQTTLAALLARWSEARHALSQRQHPTRDGLPRGLRHHSHRRRDDWHKLEAQGHAHDETFISVDDGNAWSGQAEQLRRLVYCAWTIPRAEFQLQQRRISDALLERETAQAPAQASSTAQAETRRAAAGSYAALLLRHRCAPTTPAEAKRLLASLAATSRFAVTCTPGQSLRRAEAAVFDPPAFTPPPVDDKDRRHVPLPLGPAFPHIRVSWALTLAVVSWASMCDSTAITSGRSTAGGAAEEKRRPGGDGGRGGNAGLIHLDGTRRRSGEAAEHAVLLPHRVHRLLVDEKWADALQLLCAQLRLPSPPRSSGNRGGGHQRAWWAEHRYRLYLSRRLSTKEFCRIAERHERKNRVMHRTLSPHSLTTATTLQDSVHQYIALRHIRSGAVVPRFSIVKYEGRGQRTLAYVDRNLGFDLVPLWISATIVGGGRHSHPEVIESARAALIEPVLFGEATGTHRHLLQQHRFPRRVPEWATFGYADMLHRITDHVTSLVSSLTEDTSWHQRSVAILLRPPSMSLAAASELIGGGVSTLPSDSAASAPPCLPRVAQAADDRAQGNGSLCAMANSMDNVWLSWWLQLLWSLGPIEMSLRVLGALDRDCRHEKKKSLSSAPGTACPPKVANDVVVILSAEAAVALTTTLLLHSSSCRFSTPSGPQTPLGELPQCLPFALPSSVTDPRVVFRWVGDPSFYRQRSDPVTGRPVTVKSTASPGAQGNDGISTLGAEVCPLSLLLLGAATTSSSGFSGSASRGVTETAVIWDLDIHAIVTRGRLLRQQQAIGSLLPSSSSCASEPAEASSKTVQSPPPCLGAQPLSVPSQPTPAVIKNFGYSNAVHLRHLMAWYKPAFVSTSIHANCRSLVCSLAQFPWISTSGHEGTLSPLSRDAAPPTHIQEGLINRIDRGTSGVVLAARCSATLLHARRTGMLRKGLKKRYLALVQYVPPPSPVGNHHHHRQQSSRDGDQHDNKDTRASAPLRSWDGTSVPFLLPRGYIGDRVLAEGQQPKRKDCGASDPRELLQSLQTQQPGGAEECDGYRDDAILDVEFTATTATLSSASEMRSAATEYCVLQYYPSRQIYLVKVSLESGRRHQIRQHFAGIHHPLVGDAQYNPAADTSLINRVALHALEVDLSQLALPHEPTAAAALSGGGVVSAAQLAPQRVVVGCDVPDDMLRAIHQLQRENGIDELF